MSVDLLRAFRIRSLPALLPVLLALGSLPPAAAQTPPASGGSAAPAAQGEASAGEARVYRVGESVIRWHQASPVAPSTKSSLLAERVKLVAEARATGEVILAEQGNAVETTADGIRRIDVPARLLHTMSVRPLSVQPAPFGLGAPLAIDPGWLENGDWGAVCRQSEAIARPASVGDSRNRER